MNNLLQAEVIQLSIYCDIIMAIMKRKKNLSINKLITFTYILKKNSYYMQDAFKGNTTKGLVEKALSLLNGLGEDYFASLPYVFIALDLLVESQKIAVDNSAVVLKDKGYVNEYEIGLFFEKAIEASEMFTDRQFLKEVINNV